MDKLFSTTVYYNAVVSGEKFAAQTVISSDDQKQYEEAMSDFFSTLAAKVDGNGQDLFVTFEGRAIAASAPRAATAGGSGPLPEAPANVPNCPIHKVPLKQKTNRRTNQQFFSCSERTADGYCNWTPPRAD